MFLDNYCTDDNVTGVTETEDIEVTGVTDHSNYDGVITDDDDKINALDNAIDTIAKSRSKFSRHYQLKADRTRRFQHTSGFLADENYFIRWVTMVLRIIISLCGMCQS